MKKHFLMVALVFPNVVYSDDIKWPETKYRAGDCITPIDPLWSWYGKAGLVSHIIYTKEEQSFFYYIRIQDQPVWRGDLFTPKIVDEYTAKLTSCPQ
jgi:hypothetical protein